MKLSRHNGCGLERVRFLPWVPWFYFGLCTRWGEVGLQLNFKFFCWFHECVYYDGPHHFWGLGWLQVCTDFPWRDP